MVAVVPTLVDQSKIRIIKPQAGQQEKFLASPADIVIYGGAAGGGKTYGLVLDPTRHLARPGFGAVIFRRTYPEIVAKGGLWDTALDIYPHLGGQARESYMDFKFPTPGVSVSFRHLEHANDLRKWQGAQIPELEIDELTHFTEHEFFYLTSRNRSACGIRPVTRGTCNPDPDSWVCRFIGWWIDQNTGLPIPERDGVLRYMQRDGDDIVWADKPEDLKRHETPDGKWIRPKSVTFIRASVYDNKILLDADPEYLATLMALPTVERERLLGGNWKIKRCAGDYFRRRWFGEVEAHEIPQLTHIVRYWDRASTEPSLKNPDPDWTVGILMGKSALNIFYILDVIRFRGTPGTVEERIKAAGVSEPNIPQILEKDPGQAGAAEVFHLARSLQGIPVLTASVSQKKRNRWLPVSADAERGLVKVLRAPWNEALFGELESLGPDDNAYLHDDQGDALAGAHKALARGNPRVRFA